MPKNKENQKYNNKKSEISKTKMNIKVVSNTEIDNNLTNNNSSLIAINKKENTDTAPLFKVVLPKRRTWFYNFVYRLRSAKFFEAIFGPQVKALPAPSQYRI